MRSESNQFRNAYLYRMTGAALMGFVVGVILLAVGPIAVGVIAIILSGVFGTYGVMGIYRRRGLTDAEIDSQEKADRAAVDHIAENVRRKDF
jgi:FtsH-binding integral membrane protein